MTRYTKSKVLLAGLLTAVGLLMAGCGGGYDGGTTADAANSQPDPTMALFAGDINDGAYVNDQDGAKARFTLPSGLATDSDGNIYVADMQNNVIRKISPSGDVRHFAGMQGQSGSQDGFRDMATFNYPTAVATDSDNNVYVADMFNRAIRKIDQVTGQVSTLAQALNSPAGVAVYGQTVYVVDRRDNTVVSVPSTGTNNFVTLVAGSGSKGSDNGIGAAASFSDPMGIAADSNGNLYVADLGNCAIRKLIDSAPGWQVSTLAGSPGACGVADGQGVKASFRAPSGLATDSNGNVYVSDLTNPAIRKITPGGRVDTVAGQAGGQQGGTFTPGPLPGVLGYGSRSVAVSRNSLYFLLGNAVVSIGPLPTARAP